MAGAGVRGGTTFGATDDLGMPRSRSRERPDCMRPFCNLLGMRYEQLYFENRRPARKLTGVDVNETHVVPRYTSVSQDDGK